MFADSDISSCFAEEQWEQSAYAMHERSRKDLYDSIKHLYWLYISL